MLKYKIPQIVTLILNPSGFYVDPEKLKHLEHSLEESEILSCFRVFPTTALDA